LFVSSLLILLVPSHADHRDDWQVMDEQESSTTVVTSSSTSQSSSSSSSTSYSSSSSTTLVQQTLMTVIYSAISSFVFSYFSPLALFFCC
jgi:hypothetical protein